MINTYLFALQFPDSNTIKFKCNIRVCFGQCQPQNCGGRDAYGKRRKRESEHEIEGQVYTGQLREEIQVQSNAILTLEREPERQTGPGRLAVDAEVRCYFFFKSDLLDTDYFQL